MSTGEAVLEGIAAGVPNVGPRTVHIDVTNACNAACITCWDHSPLLDDGRSNSWKKRRLSLAAFRDIVEQLERFESVESVIVSGMGDPLVHPDIYDMLALIKRAGWHLTVLSNLLAADIHRLVDAGIDQLLVGVHGATPRAYAAFHPGWTEVHFATLCRYLRALHTAGVACRHVQVINRDTVDDVVAMVRFGQRFGADRVNYKLASLYGGTEACSVTHAQRRWLIERGIPEARDLAYTLGVVTNLDLFEQQVRAALDHQRATTPIAHVGCFMGYLYTRITVDRDVLYCCNTAVKVGSLAHGNLVSMWYGEVWTDMRRRLRAGDYFPGCDKCGKFEQNVKWSRRFRAHAGDDAWRAAIGVAGDREPVVPRTPTRLPVVGAP